MNRFLPITLALTLFAGCFSLPPGPDPDLSSPYNTLSYLVNSYAIQDSGFLDVILDYDFLFVFDWDDDVGTRPGDYEIPIDWGRGSERIATQNMFAAAERILINLALEDMEPLPDGASSYTSGWIDYSIIFYYDAQDHSYYVNGSALFEMEKQGEDWIITRWSDLKAGEHSWGWLKALYRL